MGGRTLPLGRLERLVSAQEWGEAQHELRRRLLQGEMDPTTAARAHRLGASIHLRLHQHYEALVHCREGMRHAEAAGERRIGLDLLMPAGVAHLWLGNYADAVEAFQTFIVHMEELSLTAQAGKAWFNLGIAYRLQHDWETALMAYQAAADWYERLGAPAKRYLCYCERAWCECRRGRAEAAEPWLPEVRAFLESSPEPYLEEQYLCARALQLRLLGNRSESSRVCRRLLARGGSPETLGPACWVAGENALDASRVEEAWRWADLALEYAKHCPFGDVVELAYHLLNHTRETLGWVEGSTGIAEGR